MGSINDDKERSILGSLNQISIERRITCICCTAPGFMPSVFDEGRTICISLNPSRIDIYVLAIFMKEAAFALRCTDQENISRLF